MLKQWFLLVLASMVCSSAFAAVKVGNTVPVEVHEITWSTYYRSDPLPDWPDWVTVQNPNGISNCNSNFNFGDEACISENGSIKVIKLDREKVLVEHTTSQKSGGTAAPNGTIFFMQKAEFSRQLANYEKSIRQERAEEKRQEAEKQHVKRLLNN